MIPNRRHKREAELPATKPNVLVVGRRIEINVVPEVTGGTTNRPIERSEEFPPGEHAPPRQHPVLRAAQEGSDILTRGNWVGLPTPPHPP